jgi:hypothetical protein
MHARHQYRSDPGSHAALLGLRAWDVGFGWKFPEIERQCRDVEANRGERSRGICAIRLRGIGAIYTEAVDQNAVRDDSRRKSNYRRSLFGARRGANGELSRNYHLCGIAGCEDCLLSAPTTVTRYRERSFRRSGQGNVSVLVAAYRKPKRKRKSAWPTPKRSGWWQLCATRSLCSITPMDSRRDDNMIKKHTTGLSWLSSHGYTMLGERMPRFTFLKSVIRERRSRADFVLERV